MAQKLSLDKLNRLDETAFVARLGAIYEHSPWVAKEVYPARPFESRAALAAAMAAAVDAAPEKDRLALLRAHPELAGKEASAGTLTRDSKREQAGAGLDACTPDELAQIGELNRAYRDKFGFPFIIAVSGLDRLQVIAAMQTRLDNTPQAEFATALAEVDKIARIRLAALIDD